MQICKLGLQGETGNDALYLWLLFLNSVRCRINDIKQNAEMFFTAVIKV